MRASATPRSARTGRSQAHASSMLLVDATTAQHTRGIQTVSASILAELPRVTSEPLVAVAGPGIDVIDGLRLRRVAVARTRPGRLVYQRLLLPIEISRLGGG